MRRTLLPDLVLDARGARPGVGVTIEGGRVVSVGPAAEGERLPGRALAPGFANAHSHAFQRGLRGGVERRDPAHPRDDFWTWRERMYALAGSLDPASLREASERCYREMLSAGYTSVAEFHYLHHRPDGAPYEDPNALAKAVAAGAEAVGMRLLLLPAAYARGGLSRFRDASAGEFLARVEELRAWAEGHPLVEVGLAAHSVRAVPRGWLEEIGEHARGRSLPLHVHACEQPREVEECRREHGLRPVELLAEAGFLGPGTVVVHATHASEGELDLLAERGAGVCACPTTEGNLGDGFLPAEGLLRRGIGLSVGSDSHVRVDPFEELREIETNARRLSGRRNVLVPEGEGSPTPWLLRAGWGREGISAGDPADLVEIDLGHPALADVEPEDLPSALVFGAGSGVVCGAWVAGRRVYPEGGGA
ncbi:amidohydrolase [Rubrobacter xylanophilus DSM 9941]|uniref:Amidohydrolase n=1 Tax=Rubrobacter xylanophilus (strain DSM 9941 / JCM 11954 / NBRC 16129 / PRD-1) TaxID=266117 RepID=Q1AYH2_RUBXD|nr:formimidoylglutamate deiminase [Rubrobacter xylanophilus]ABG03556.1 amidohydrolase [Rubrobacter xylanophilus DSM 9941]